MGAVPFLFQRPAKRLGLNLCSRSRHSENGSLNHRWTRMNTDWLLISICVNLCLSVVACAGFVLMRERLRICYAESRSPLFGHRIRYYGACLHRAIITTRTRRRKCVLRHHAARRHGAMIIVPAFSGDHHPTRTSRVVMGVTSELLSGDDHCSMGTSPHRGF